MAGSIKGITIEIGGNTTKLSQALKQSSSEVVSLRNQLKDVNKALQLDPSNVETLNQKQRLLTQAISSTEEELKILKEAQRQYVESGKDIDGKEYTALEAKIAITEKALKNLQAQQNNFNGTVQAMGLKLEAFGEKASKTGSVLTKGLTTPIVAVGTAATAAWNEIDQAYDNIAAGTGATGSALAELQDSFDHVFGDFSASSEDVSTAIADINTRFGLTEKTLEDASGRFLKFSRVNSIDVSGAVKSVAKAMADAGIETKDLGSFLDRLTVASQASGMSVDAIAEALSKNGYAMRELGYDTDETIALLTTFEKHGVDTSTMLTAFKTAVKNCAKEGKDAKSEISNFFASVANGTADATQANELFGSKAGAAILAYAREGKLNISEMMDVLRSSTDSLSKSYDEMFSDSEKTTIALNNLKLAGKELGDTIMKSLAPLFEKLAVKAKELAAWFSSLSDRQKELIVKIGAGVAAAGPLLLVIGKLSTGMGVLIKYLGSTVTVGGRLLSSLSSLFGVVSIGAGTILGVVAAVGALVGAFATLWNSSESFRKKMVAIWDSIVSKVNAFCQGIVDRLNNLGFKFKDITEVISTIWKGFCDFLAPVFIGVWKQVEIVLSSVFDVLLGILDVFVGIFTGNWEQAFNGIGSVVSTVFNGIKQTLENAFGLIRSIIETFLSWFGIKWDADLSGIKRVWESIWNGISSFFKAITNTIKSLFNAFSKLFQGDFKGFCNEISKVWKNIWEGIKNFASSVWNGIGNLAQSCWNGISNFFVSTLSNISNAFGNVWNGITSFLSNTWNGIGNIASSAWNSICNAVTYPLQVISDSVSNVFGGIYNTIQNSMERAARFISDIISNIKNFFNFNIQWPHIPLPHFSISPRGWQIGDLLDGVIPGLGIEWYAKAMNKGMILNSPTVFGASNGKLLAGGEAGAEAVVGVNALDQMIDQSIDRALRNALESSRKAQSQVQVQQTEIDYDKLAQAMISGLGEVTINNSFAIGSRQVANEILPLVDKGLERRKNRR